MAGATKKETLIGITITLHILYVKLDFLLTGGVGGGSVLFMGKTYSSEEVSALYQELARERKANKLAIAVEAAGLAHLFRDDVDHMTAIDWELVGILADVRRPPSDETKAAVREIVERNKRIHFDAMRTAELREAIADHQREDRLSLVS